MKIAITGASRFVGQYLVPYLIGHGHHITGLSRHPPLFNITPSDYMQVDYRDIKSLENAMEGCDQVIHLAGVAHTKTATKADYWRGNIETTKHITIAAKLAGLKRITYISSIKAMGETTHAGKPFKYNTPPAPVDDYGKSKLEAEKEVIQACTETNLEWTIIRPPLIKGPTARGNLATLSKAIAWRLPLPLGHINNRRDLVSIDTLNSFIQHCVQSTTAKNNTFLISDGQPVSTTELVLQLAKEAEKSVNLFSLPKPLRQYLRRKSKTAALANRIFDNLQVDIEHTCKTLNWNPEMANNNVRPELVKAQN